MTVNFPSREPVYSFRQNYPTREATERARDEADLQRAVLAYRFWYSTVSMEAVFTSNRELGIRDGERIPILSAGPRHLVPTANSDTPYGGGVFDLRSGPLVVELPPGPLMALANDHHQRWIMDMGLAGPDGGRGGKHVILPPGHEGEVPAGCFVGRAGSYKVLVAIRAIPPRGDLQGAFELLRHIKIHPASGSDASMAVDFEDVTERPISGPLLLWEDNLRYWERLHRVINDEPAVPEYAAMYGLLRALGVGRGQSFAPDARMKAILERAAREGRAQMMVAAFASRRPDRLVWRDRHWEWVGLVPDDPGFVTSGGMDLEARDRWQIQSILTSPAMFRRTPQVGSLYWLGARDASGAFLDGGKRYRLTVPLPVPAKLFWSVTVYDAGTRTAIQTEQDKAALRSLFELKDVAGRNADLYFGPSAPEQRESRWIKTHKSKGWFAYFRIYGPEQRSFDGSWRPGDFEELP